jgi:phage tail sheath protein FI
VAAALGIAPKADAYVDAPRECNNWPEFVRDFMPEDSKPTPLAYAVYGYFMNGGRRLYVVNVGASGTIAGDARKGTGIHALLSYPEPSMVFAPGYNSPADCRALLDHAEKCGDRIAIIDGPESIEDTKELTEVATVDSAGGEGEGGGRRTAKSKAKRPPDSKFGVCYFPWIKMSDPFGGKEVVAVPPSGHMAGIYAMNDYLRGVHKAPANYAVRTAIGLSQRLTPEQHGVLNTAGVNVIRFFGTSGIRVWGARTLSTVDREWMYVNVERIFIMVQRSLIAGTNWVVFEPNDQNTRNFVARDCRAFLKLLWLDGALVGATPEQAFFVKCDAENNPAEVVDAGRLIVDIGIAPSKPAEFIVFRIGQWSGGTEVQAA